MMIGDRLRATRQMVKGGRFSIRLFSSEDLYGLEYIQECKVIIAQDAHAGEALASRQAFHGMSAYDRDCIVEFLKTLQILPPGTHSKD